ncbi:DUF3048 domain-containing protein [Streptomyces sp. NPDC058572]|uniref:DUF3048 domain-containing protein n=1 Tax=Streptomyces sp. NPDC058572 TaxID=3346546 RepID=UPI003655A16F
MDAKRRSRPAGRIVTAAASAMAAAVFFGCSGSGRESSPEPTPAPPVSAAGQQGLSYFTGLPARSAPVLAVKIDNVLPARPHTGLAEADIVYVEQVEAGQSRLLAIYSSRLPEKVGPVRSARESDIELLGQFGRPALAYSGSQSALRPLIHAAPLVALAQGDAPQAYVRDRTRLAPHNLYLDPERALAAAPQATTAGDIGFLFGAAPAGGTPVSEHTVRFPAARFTFTWSGTEQRWLVGMDGGAARTTDGERLGAPTVVVQYVDIHPSRFSDRGGSVSPYTESVGAGSAVVLRDGRSHDARWSRPTAASGTSFTTATGLPLAFAPGQVWVVLAAR